MYEKSVWRENYYEILESIFKKSRQYKRIRGLCLLSPVSKRNQCSAIMPQKPSLLIKRGAAAGRESYSDKQLLCYKGGRKSIKLDNKIAIEFLWLFIAAACILMCSSAKPTQFCNTSSLYASSLIREPCYKLGGNVNMK